MHTQNIVICRQTLAHTLTHITLKNHSLTHNSFTAQSSVLLYHCKKGELSHSWSGRLVEQQLGNETANMSRTILDGIIQQGDSDPEFAGTEREKERDRVRVSIYSYYL